jgi:hypothetical protein
MSGIIGNIPSRSKIVDSFATVGQGGTGVGTFTDGGVLLGSGADAITATAALADGEMLVGDGTTDPAIESGGTLRTSIGLGSVENTALSTWAGTTNITTLGTVTTGNIDALSDVVKIAGGAFSSATAIAINQCFSSTYKFYRLLIGDIKSSVSVTRIGFLDTSNNPITDSYYAKAIEMYSDSGGGITAWTNSSTVRAMSADNNTQGFSVYGGWQMGGGTLVEGTSLDMQFYDPNNTAKSHVMWTISVRDTNYVLKFEGQGLCNSTTAVYGLNLISNPNNFDARGHYALYGYKV